jgi:uncharacterized membrane protein
VTATPSGHRPREKQNSNNKDNMPHQMVSAGAAREDVQEPFTALTSITAAIQQATAEHITKVGHRKCSDTQRSTSNDCRAHSSGTSQHLHGPLGFAGLCQPDALFQRVLQERKTRGSA